MAKCPLFVSSRKKTPPAPFQRWGRFAYMRFYKEMLYNVRSVIFSDVFRCRKRVPTLRASHALQEGDFPMKKNLQGRLSAPAKGCYAFFSQALAFFLFYFVVLVFFFFAKTSRHTMPAAARAPTQPRTIYSPVLPVLSTAQNTTVSPLPSKTV